MFVEMYLLCTYESQVDSSEEIGNDPGDKFPR